MPEITLELGDAAELAEMLTFLAGWLTGSQKQTLADSFTAFAGHPAYNTDAHAVTCTGLSSSSGSATAKSSSASRRHDEQGRADAPCT
jgi:hypothetical protein